MTTDEQLIWDQIDTLRSRLTNLETENIVLRSQVDLIIGLLGQPRVVKLPPERNDRERDPDRFGGR